MHQRARWVSTTTDWTFRWLSDLSHTSSSLYDCSKSLKNLYIRRFSREPPRIGLGFRASNALLCNHPTRAAATKSHFTMFHDSRKCHLPKPQPMGTFYLKRNFQSVQKLIQTSRRILVWKHPKPIHNDWQTARTIVTFWRVDINPYQPLFLFPSDTLFALLTLWSLFPISLSNSKRLWRST